MPVLAELPQGATFRFTTDGPEMRRRVLAAGGGLVVVQSVGALHQSTATFLGTLEVVPLEP